MSESERERERESERDRERERDIESDRERGRERESERERGRERGRERALLFIHTNTKGYKWPLAFKSLLQSCTSGGSRSTVLEFWAWAVDHQAE